MALEVGEKYLTLEVLGNKVLRFPLFPNKNKKNPNEPDFKGEGLAVWVNEKQPPKETPQFTQAIAPVKPNF